MIFSIINRIIRNIHVNILSNIIITTSFVFAIVISDTITLFIFVYGSCSFFTITVIVC